VRRHRRHRRGGARKKPVTEAVAPVETAPAPSAEGAPQEPATATAPAPVGEAPARRRRRSRGGRGRTRAGAKPLAPGAQPPADVRPSSEQHPAPIAAPLRKTFAHPSEAEFAKLLDYYGIRWEYEPRSFPLHWEGERVTEMQTPDFYLIDLDLYIELTTLKQSLVTEKNRKIRRLKELYPDVNIKLLYKRDYHRLLAKYGYGPLGKSPVEGVERVLLTTEQIQKRVAELGRQISLDYMGRRIVLVGVLKGVLCFMADLLRHVTIPVSVEFLAISYYGAGAPGGIRVTKELDKSINGKHVLLVEDIVDTGMTLNFIRTYLLKQKPASLEICSLLDKKIRRLVDVPVKYVGMEIPDEFVVGYGLDYREEYRNLPYIGVLRPEEQPEVEAPE